jgi:ABC-type nitrate/sulfonate/bicarbonate transport system ATPase subunit
VLTLDHKCSLLCVQHHTDEAMLLHKRVCTLDPNHTKKVCAAVVSKTVVSKRVVTKTVTSEPVVRETIVRTEDVTKC